MTHPEPVYPRRWRQWRGLPAITLALSTLALTGGCEQSDGANGGKPPPAPAGKSSSPAANVPDASRSESSSKQKPNAAKQASESATNAGAGASAQSPADAQYAAILSQVVTDDGLVRYKLLAGEDLRKQLDAVVAGYAQAKLPDESQAKARLALWCNAYNANAMKMAQEESSKDGFKSVHDVLGFFDQRAITVAGESLTLDGLEDRMRAMKDPRIHAALVGGAMSSPSLRNEPFTADRLEAQLDEQSRSWLDDLGKNRITRTAILLSQIFEWRAADFEVEPYGGVKGFLKKKAHPNGAIRDFLRAVPEVKIEYVPHNWALNDAGE